jgi:hypothetical protein
MKSTILSKSLKLVTRFSRTRFQLTSLAFLLSAQPAFCQLATGWKQHDMKRQLPAVVEPGQSNLPLAPPSDAIVLFDGSSLDAWQGPEGKELKWIIRDGAMEPIEGGGYAYSVQGFGDVQLHLEWASPQKVQGKSQGRGNSGVFLQSQFEVQILDSFENPTYADGQAGSIYGQYPPLVNVSRKPGQWQSYDIIYRAPTYEPNGELAQPSRITVLHNGVLIQDNVRPLGPTSWMQHHPYSNRGDKLPIGLQDHGNPVRFRNIWVRELPPEKIIPPTEPYDPIRSELTDQHIANLLGTYERKGGGRYEVIRKDGKLFFTQGGPMMEMIPHSPTEFGLRFTAGLIEFEKPTDGPAKSLRFEMGGSTNEAKRPKQTP